MSEGVVKPKVNKVRDLEAQVAQLKNILEIERDRADRLQRWLSDAQTSLVAAHAERDLARKERGDYVSMVEQADLLRRDLARAIAALEVSGVKMPTFERWGVPVSTEVGMDRLQLYR